MDDDKTLKEMARGAGIIFISTFLIFITRFIYRLIISRYFGPSQYGLITFGEMVMEIGFVISILGLTEGLIRYISYYKGQKNNAKIKGIFWSTVKISIPLSIAVSGILIIFSNQISSGIFGNYDFAPILVIFALIIPFNTILKILLSTQLALKKPGYFFISGYIGRVLIQLIFTIIIILVGGTILDISRAYLISIIISIIIGIILIEKVFPFIKKSIKAKYDYKELIYFSAPLFFAAVFIDIANWADTFFIGYFLTEFEVGIYNVALPLASGIGIFLIAAGQILYPIISQLIGEDKKQEIGEQYSIIARWIFMASLPIFLIMIIFPRQIISLLFGSAYEVGALVLTILVIGYFVNIITGPGIQTLKAFKKTKYIFKLNITMVGLNIILNIILIPLYGIEGAAIATAFTLMLREIMIFFKAKRLSNFTLKLNYYVKYLISGLIPIAILYYTSRYLNISLIILIGLVIIYFIVYIILLILLKSFKREDIKIILLIEKKLGLNLKIIKKLLRKFL